MLPEKLHDLFTSYHEAVRDNDVLDPKTTVMLQLATSMCVGCYP